MAINQNIQITRQQLETIVRQFNSQNSQQTTNGPTPYYLKAGVHTNTITCSSPKHTNDVPLLRTLGTHATVLKTV